MLSRRHFFNKVTAATAGLTIIPSRAVKRETYSSLNVMDVGAKGDGITDDSDAIQEAINYICKKGGGKIFFPYMPKGYKIDKPASETIDGKPCRGQLYVNSKTSDLVNICLEGEHPCVMLYTYQIREKTEFHTMGKANTFLFSTWEAPEESIVTSRPWSMLATVEGTFFAGKFGIAQISIRNLEFRTLMNINKMYPTSGGLNLQNSSRINIQDSQICLDKNIGDVVQQKELLPNPCHVAGLIASGNQNDNQVLRNVAVQGYKYGFVLGEHVVADYLYVHNCEEGIVFHDSTHLSHIQHIVAQHNQKILTTTRENLFGTTKSRVYVNIEGIDFEAGKGTRPAVSQMTHGVYDPENRLHGYLKWHCGFPTGDDYFPIEGGIHMTISKF